MKRLTPGQPSNPFRSLSENISRQALVQGESTSLASAVRLEQHW